MPPDDGIHEELARRSKERGELLRVWEELMQKALFALKGKAQGWELAILVLPAANGWNPRTPKLRFEGLTPADENPLAWEVVQMHKRQILQAELEGDWRFLRQLSDATKLLKTGQALRPFS